MSLGTTIKSIQDIMRKDVGVDGDAQRIGQLGWLLFLKVLDDRGQERELLDDSYISPLPGRLCTTNLLLHGLDVPTQVVRDNTLARPLRTPRTCLTPGSAPSRRYSSDSRAWIATRDCSSWWIPHP